MGTISWAKMPTGSRSAPRSAFQHRQKDPRVSAPGICERLVSQLPGRVWSALEEIWMPTISKGRTPLTFINVFTVAPENQGGLIKRLADETQQKVTHHDGVVAAGL